MLKMMRKEAAGKAGQAHPHHSHPRCAGVRPGWEETLLGRSSQLQETGTELSIKPFNSQTTHMHNVLLHRVKRKKKNAICF